MADEIIETHWEKEIVNTKLFWLKLAITLSGMTPIGPFVIGALAVAFVMTLKQALALVDVKALDHFVIAGPTVVSFAERGLL